MKRLAWIVAGLLGIASHAFAAYDGPSPVLTYDHTLDSIHVVFTTQSKMQNGGRLHFAATIQAPVQAHNVGKQVKLEIWKYVGAGDLLIDDTCRHTVTAGEANTTITFNCEIWELVPGSQVIGTNVDIYPKVIKDSTNPGLVVEHNGFGNPLSVPVVGDDAFETNNTLLAATTLSPVKGVPLIFTDLVSRLDADFFKFVVPANVFSADITLEFWNAANDIDLWIYDEFGNQVDGSVSSTDMERIILSVTPGQTYYFGVEAGFDYNPAFYDMKVVLGDAHTVTGSPTGTPNPVASGGTVALVANAGDTLGHTLTYSWHQSCPGFALGTFSDRFVANTTWTAPVNTSGVPKTCTITVDLSDGIIDTVFASFVQTVESAVDSVTISSGPAGSPNPVPSAGTVLLSATAVDTFNHTITYGWTASCPTLGGNGSFTPSASVASPTWTAPANPGGSQQACTITLNVNDGLGHSDSKNYSQNVLSEAGLTHKYYFAEGATIGGFFETRFALLNSDPTNTVTVAMDFQLKDTTTVLTHNFNIAPHSRTTINVSTLGSINPALAQLASAEFSTVVRSDRPLVADRTMTWDNSGYGSHAETAIDAPASEWYLAEGATIGDFELYYLIQNPNAEPLNDEIEVTYLLPPPAAPIVRHYSMGANTRTNIVVHLEPGLENVELSAIIRTPVDKPVIVERAMYLTAGGYFYGAGHESAGIKAPATQWFFAEGATGEFFDLFILIGNPSPNTAHVTATFLFDDGTTCSLDTPVDPMSRYNIWVDATEIAGCPRSLANAAVSTTITSDIPVIAERAMWWPGPSAANWAEAHNAAGATSTGTKWGLADGEQGNARGNETYILIANTSNFEGTARVTLYLEDGSTMQKDFTLPPNSRTNVAVGAPVEAGGFGSAIDNKRFGSIVESLPGAGGTAQIVVERAMYSNGPGAPFWAAGTDVLATKLQ